MHWSRTLAGRAGSDPAGMAHGVSRTTGTPPTSASFERRITVIILRKVEKVEFLALALKHAIETFTEAARRAAHLQDCSTRRLGSVIRPIDMLLPSQ